MNFTKLIKSSLIVLFISLSVPAFSTPVDTRTELATLPAGNLTTTDALARLKEIKSMDLKSLSRSERKGLRKEVRGIRKQLKDSSHGVYLSLGALIIIGLLLLLLL